MKLHNYIIMIMVVAVTFACQTDPLFEIKDGEWNKERNILAISFENQIGNPTIKREGNTATIDFTCNTTNLPNLSAIKLNLLEVSYMASASVKAGDALNFDNADKKVVIDVTPANGEPLQWIIILHPFDEELLGTWDVKGLYVYGGTGPAYGGAYVAKMTDKAWNWSATDGPGAEQDNSLTFTLVGVNEEGNPYGNIVNNAGADGKYANFMFISKTPAIDLNGFYRTIPKENGTWLRNYTTGTVTFTFTDGTSKTCSFVNPGTIDLGDGKSRTITEKSFQFTLKGVDDWGSIYSDYDVFAKNPRKYWVDIKKRP